MSEIEQVAKRITTALDRVGQVLNSGNTEQAEAVKGELSALQVKFAEVQTALADNARKLEDKDKKVSLLQRELDRANEQCEDLEGKVRFVRQKAWRFRKWTQEQGAEQKKIIEDLDQKLQALGEVNRALRENNRKLREANAEGLADVELINTSLQAELESVRAHRDVEIAELGAAYKSLQSLLDALEYDDDLSEADDFDPDEAPKGEAKQDEKASKSTKEEDA